MPSLEAIVSTGELARMVGRQPASADAQSGAQQLGIQNIARGVMRVVSGPSGAETTVSSTTFAALSPALKGEMMLCGRPLRVSVAGAGFAGAGGTLKLDILVRGVGVAGANSGVYVTQSTVAVGFCASDVLMSPAPGPAVIEVVALRATADATLLTGANDRLVLLAEEL